LENAAVFGSRDLCAAVVPRRMQRRDFRSRSFAAGRFEIRTYTSVPGNNAPPFARPFRRNTVENRARRYDALRAKGRIPAKYSLTPVINDPGLSASTLRDADEIKKTFNGL